MQLNARVDKIKLPKLLDCEQQGIVINDTAFFVYLLGKKVYAK